MMDRMEFIIVNPDAKRMYHDVVQLQSKHSSLLWHNDKDKADEVMEDIEKIISEFEELCKKHDVQ